jgi:hypothetical protein
MPLVRKRGIRRTKADAVRITVREQGILASDRALDLLEWLLPFPALPFAIFAALTAFSIEYEEQRHQYRGWRGPLKVALTTSLIAFLGFGAITVVTVIALPIVAR